MSVENRGRVPCGGVGATPRNACLRADWLPPKEIRAAANNGYLSANKARRRNEPRPPSLR